MRNQLVQRLTLIEILLGLMLILIVLSLFSAIFQSPIDKPKETSKESHGMPVNLELTNALKLYKLDNGFFPTTEQGLQALVVKPTLAPVPGNWTQYLKKIPLDPMGKPYQYFSEGNSFHLRIKRPHSKHHLPLSVIAPVPAFNL